MSGVENSAGLFKGLVAGLGAIVDATGLLYLVLLTAVLIMLLVLLVNQLKYESKKRRFTVLKNRKDFLWKATNYLLKYHMPGKLLNNIALKIAMYNSYSHQKNLEHATLLCIVSAIFTFMSVIVFLPSASALWYITLGYILIAMVFVYIAFITFTFMARIRFTSRLPAAYKLLNSRYITTGNILKAIYISMDDFDRAIKREMQRVYNVLKKNDMGEIEQTFKRLEDTYRNQYLTLLLNLVLQAHYKGGDEAIKKQFESTTEEILNDIENQKDLSSTARIYIFLALLLPAGMKWMESFNHSALGEKAAEFYSSPAGIEIKIVFYFLFLLYLGILLFMERTA